MLVYEKKNDEGVRHLYGNFEGTIPTAADPQLTYKDAQGNVETIVAGDSYFDDKHGGITRKSDGKAVNVFIGTHQIIPKNASNNVEVEEEDEEPIQTPEPEEEELEEPEEELEEEPEEEEELEEEEEN